MTATVEKPVVSFFCQEAAAFVLLGAALVLWPLLATGGHPFMMVDSSIYADQGERIWRVVGTILSPPAPVQTPTDGAGAGSVASPAGTSAIDMLRAQSNSDDTVRSVPYAAFVGLFQPLGLVWVLYAQAVLVMASLYAVIAPLLRRLSRWHLALAGVLALFASPLPMMASYFMPDIFGAVVILCAVRIVMGLEGLDRASRVGLIAIAILAISFHYGNLPLAVVLFGLAALLRPGRRSAIRTLVFVAGGIALAAIGLNVLIGKTAFGSASVAPNRAPIVLARSIEDGPARWVLEEDCARDAPRYALCDYWGTDIPANVGDALWSEGGMNDAPPDLYARIRAEELDLLLAGFRSHPLQQIAGLLGNTLDQFVTVHASYARAGQFEIQETGRRTVEPVPGLAFERLRPLLSAAHMVGYVLGLLGLIALAVGAGFRTAARIAWVVLAGLVLNAAVFGGLSAPVSRYQARVAWLAITLAALFLADRYLRRAGQGAVAEAHNAGS